MLLKKKLGGLKSKHHHLIKEVRIMGLIIGIELNIKGEDVYKECLKEGLLINCTQDTVLRIMPPLNVMKKQVDRAVSILDRVFSYFNTREGGFYEEIYHLDRRT